MEIKTCVDLDNGEPFYFYAKGKHDPVEFAEQLKHNSEIWGYDTDPARVRYAYLRFGVSARIEPGSMEIFKYDEPGRGRFMATIYDLWIY